MASIRFDNLTEGKWRVRWTDAEGEHEEFCETREQAQILANKETAWKLAKYENPPSEEPKKQS